jgi:four helix bundle protein
MQREKLKDSEQNSKSDIKRRSYEFALKIIRLVDSLPSSGSSNIIGNQLLRSATSIGANIIEAQAGSSKRDFKNFLSHALKSANETKFWLGLLRDANKKPASEINPLLIEAKELANILAASIITLKKRVL